MIPSLAVFGLIQILCLVTVGVPPIFLDSADVRAAYVATLTAVGGGISVALFWVCFLAPLRRVTDGLRVAKIDLRHVHPTTLSADAAPEVPLSVLGQLIHAPPRTVDVAIRATSHQSDLFLLECAARDAAMSSAACARLLFDLEEQQRHTGRPQFSNPNSEPFDDGAAVVQLKGRHAALSPIASDDMHTCVSDANDFPAADAERALSRNPSETSPDVTLQTLRSPPPALILLRRGDRFCGDSHRIALVIERNINANIVVYEAASLPPFKAAKAVEAFWLNLDAEYVKQARLKGITTDRTELTVSDRRQGYGFDVRGGGPSFWITFALLPNKSFALKWEEVLCGPNPQQATKRKVPVIIGAVGGRESYIERFFFHVSDDDFSRVVKTVELFGCDTLTGEPQHEHVNLEVTESASL